MIVVLGGVVVVVFYVVFGGYYYVGRVGLKWCVVLVDFGGECVVVFVFVNDGVVCGYFFSYFLNMLLFFLGLLG